MYTLFDQEDQDSWERRRQELEDLDALMPSMPGAPPSLAGVAIPPPDMSPGGYGMPQYQPPAAASMPPLAVDDGPDWTDALNVGLVGLGGIVDLAANHGKNFGAIAASGAQYGAARAGQRVEQEKDRLAYEERRAQLARQNSYNDLAYQQLLYRQLHDQDQGERADKRQGTADRNAATKERQAALAENREDPSELKAWAKARGHDLDGLETMGQVRAALGPLMREWDLEHAGEKAASVAAATEPSRIRVAEAQGRASAGARADVERDVAAAKRIGNADIADPDVWASQAQNSTAYNHANAIAQARAVFKQSIEDMIQLQGTNGMMVLPSGRKSSYESAASGAIGSLTTLFQTGVINEAEYKRYRDRIPSAGLSAAGLYGAATDQNVVGEQLTGTRDELLKIFERGLNQYGLTAPREDGGGNVYRAGNGRAQASGAQPMPGGTMNAPTGGPATLEAPGMNPAQLGAGARSYTVKMPGRPDITGKMLTPDKVQALIAAGAQVIPE